MVVMVTVAPGGGDGDGEVEIPMAAKPVAVTAAVVANKYS